MRCGPRIHEQDRAAFFDAIEAESELKEASLPQPPFGGCTDALIQNKTNPLQGSSSPTVSVKEKQMQTQDTLKSGNFPFKLENLKSWTLKRTDGTVTKFVLSSTALVGTKTESGISRLPLSSSQTQNRTVSGYGSYCAHTPGSIPSAIFERPEGPLKLWVANMSGARTTKDKFEFVIDAGDIISLYSGNYTSKLLDGDPELVAALNPYGVEIPKTRLLKIDWNDRAAPDVIPEFWTRLNEIIYGDVMTCCVGGHGRSGTTFTCLLLNNAPDYDALDAIIHLRAVHCPRAIESIVQHEYINDVATYLGREANAKQASQISDYKAAFMNSTKPTAIATRKYLGWDKVEETK